MFVRRLLLHVVWFAFTGGFAVAQQQTFHVEPGQSQVHFTLTDPLHTVHGTFKVQGGSVGFSSSSGAMSGEVVVDAASGESGNATRDRRMTREELIAPKYGTVRFSPRHFSGTLNPTGDSNITIEGDFTLLGTAHPIQVPMKVHFQGSTCTAKGTFQIPYIEWGLKDPSKFLLKVSNQVTIDLDLSGPVTKP